MAELSVPKTRLTTLVRAPGFGSSGASESGFGWSLVYPGFGIEAVRRAPEGQQGLAMGAYTAFLDLALGVASPLLGLVASRAGLNTVFLTSASILESCSDWCLRC